MIHWPEHCFANAIYGRLRAAGVRCVLEVPCLSRCIDMVVMCGPWYIAVEFKMHAWKRALAQATDHLLAVDYSVVCMPERQVSPQMYVAFADAGVGLWLAQSAYAIRATIPPAPSLQVWPVARQWLTEYLQTRAPEVLVK